MWLRVGCGTAPLGTKSVHSGKACGAALFCSLCMLFHLKKKKSESRILNYEDWNVIV